MRKHVTLSALFAVAFAALPGAIGWRIVQATASPNTVAASANPDPARVARGEYLVRTSGCNDCHTPWKLGPKGPEPDMTRALTGHPSNLVMPAAPKLPEPWAWSAAITNTAFAGPWGVSFTANLTPDDETGLGKWTEEMFIRALRTGRHEGKGRPILPPMPWSVYGQMEDEDLKSIYAYLRTLKPVHNRVPAPIDPPEAAR